MILSDFHVHTTYCDGRNTPEEMVLSAIDLGMERIGFSGHSYTFFDESYCMSQKRTEEYIKEIATLREKYAGKIRILCGVEQDYYSDAPTDRFDYVIGSVHYVKVKDGYIPVDVSREILEIAVSEHFGGDFYALAEEYFRTSADVVNGAGADIIGHFDLISKFNEDCTLFDEHHPRYVRAWRSAADLLLQKNVPFELNTGAISRGYRSKPYPSPDIIEYIRSHKGRMILSSDSHSRDTLCFGFAEYAALVK